MIYDVYIEIPNQAVFAACVQKMEAVNIPDPASRLTGWGKGVWIGPVVSFDSRARATHQATTISITHSFADTMGHKPCGLVGDT